MDCKIAAFELAMTIGVLGTRPEYTVPVMERGTKSAQFLPLFFGFSAELPTTAIVNCWPANFNVSFPLTNVDENVPVAVKVTFALESGLAAAMLPGAARKQTAAAAAVKNNFFLKSNENIPVSLFWSILEV